MHGSKVPLRCICIATRHRKMSIRRTRAASLTSDVRPNSNTTVDVPAARTTLRSYQRSDRVLVVGRALGSRAGGALPPRPSDRTVFLHSYRRLLSIPDPAGLALAGGRRRAPRGAGSRIIITIEPRYVTFFSFPFRLRHQHHRSLVGASFVGSARVHSSQPHRHCGALCCRLRRA